MHQGARHEEGGDEVRREGIVSPYVPQLNCHAVYIVRVHCSRSHLASETDLFMHKDPFFTFR